MKCNKKKIVAISVLTVLFFMIVIQTKTLHSDFKKVERPTMESRRLSDLATYKWMTVQQMSKRYGMPQKQVFTLLDISEKPGDEKLDIRTLGKKYGKTPGEMKQNIHKILQQSIKNGKKS